MTGAASITSRQPGCIDDTKKVCTKASKVCDKAVTTSSGMLKISKLTARVVEFATAILSGMSGAAKNIFNTFKTADTVLTTFDIFARPKDWIEWSGKKTTKWHNTASLVTLTASQSFGLVAFISKIAEWDFRSALGFIGRVPVIGLIGEALQVIGFGVFAIDQSIEMQANARKLEKLTIKKAVINIAHDKKLDNATIGKYTQKYEKALLKNLKKGDAKFTAKMAKFAVFISSLNTSEKRISKNEEVMQKIKKLDLKEDSFICLIAFGILKATVATLAIIGMATGAKLLAVTSIPMIGIHLTIASISMFRFLYSAYNN
jgi:hypothetical protein